MKIELIILLLFIGCTANLQQLDSLQKENLKEKIINSMEAKEWQNSMIAFRESDMEFCALKKKQHSIEKSRLNVSHSKPSRNIVHEDLLLKLFRSMRITRELKNSATTKEKLLRAKFPEIVTHFLAAEIFEALYAPILRARKD